MKFQAAARAIPGSKEVQEDAWRVYDAKGGDAGEIAVSDAGVALSGGGLVLVADGIGGHHGGEVASAITADNFVRQFFATGGNAESRLKSALDTANSAVADAQQKEPSLRDMGATLVSAYIEGEEMSFVSVGDSLILRYRDGELHRVNVDHSYLEIADREALGTDDRELWRDVITRKGRDSITIAVLGRSLEDFGHSPQIATRKILPGDVMILSSDGLETLSMVQIQNFIRELLPRGVNAVADGLVKAVDGIGGNRNYQDNTTLVVVQADGVQLAKIAPATVSEAEPAKTAPLAPKTAPVAPAASPAATPATSSQKSGTISSSARSGKWSPAKFLLGVALGLIAVAAVLYASGVMNSFRPLSNTVTVPARAPAPASAPAGDTVLKKEAAPAGGENAEPTPRNQLIPRQQQQRLIPPRHDDEYRPRPLQGPPSFIPDSRSEQAFAGSPAEVFRHRADVSYYAQMDSQEYCD